MKVGDANDLLYFNQDSLVMHVDEGAADAEIGKITTGDVDTDPDGNEAIVTSTVREEMTDLEPPQGDFVTKNYDIQSVSLLCTGCSTDRAAR